MLQPVNQTEPRDLEWSCQAVSAIDEPCDSAATFTAISADGGSAPSTLRMRAGTPAAWSRGTRVARLKVTKNG